MTYSDKAREIADLLCSDERGNGAARYEVEIILAALSEAHAAGREEMKEEAERINSILFAFALSTTAAVKVLFKELGKDSIPTKKEG